MSTTPSKTEPFQTGRVVSIAVAHFIHDIYTSFLPPLLPLIIEKLSLSLMRAGFLYTALQLPSLLNPFLGVMADRISIRLFVIFAPLMTALAMSFIGLAPSYGVLVVLLLTAGVSTSLFHVPAPVMVARVSGSRVGLGMSFFMTGGEFSRTVGPLVAVGAISVFGLDGFYKVVVAGVLATAWLFIKVRDVPAPVSSASRPSLADTWREMRGFFKPLFVILAFRSFMHGSLGAFLPTYLRQESGSLWLGGIGLTILEAGRRGGHSHCRVHERPVRPSTRLGGGLGRSPRVPSTFPVRPRTLQICISGLDRVDGVFHHAGHAGHGSGPGR